MGSVTGSGPSDSHAGKAARVRADRALADVLTSILYAAYLGEPDGPALSGGNVASRHDLALTPTIPPRPIGAWRLPAEDFRTRSGWHVTGSLLGLETALARLALRRLDSSTMPTESRLSTADRQTAALTVALLNPHHLTDAGRDEIAAALGRGRARLASLRPNRDEMERVAKAAGLSEWRREALAWTLTQDPGRSSSALSLVELLWLGAPRPSAAAPLDPWGAATLPLTGCPCLQMPRAAAWEDLAGRPSQGGMATRAADVVASRGGSTGHAQAPGIAGAGNCRPRDARRAGRCAPGVFRRLVRFYKSGNGPPRGEVGRLHRCIDRRGPAHPRASNGSVARTTMTLRGELSLAVAIAAVLALPPTASTIDQAPALHISAPTEGTYTSGPTRLVAIVEPTPRAGEVSQVTFFADGHQVCVVPKPPFQCDWDAGERLVEHQVRAVALLASGERLVDTVRTQGLQYSEGVDVDVVQVTAVVTDGGRFVRGLRQSDFRVFEDDRAQTITNFVSREHPAGARHGDRRQLQHDGGASDRQRISQAFSRGPPAERPGDGARLQRQHFHGGETCDGPGCTRAGDRSDGAVGRHGALRRDDQGDRSARPSAGPPFDRHLQRRGRPVEPRARSTQPSRAQKAATRRSMPSVRGGPFTRRSCRICSDSSRRSAADARSSPTTSSSSARCSTRFSRTCAISICLSYPAPSTLRDGAWHRIRVEVPGGKYHVRARQGYRLAPHQQQP